jgi:hypothetical protein
MDSMSIARIPLIVTRGKYRAGSARHYPDQHHSSSC